MPEHILSCVSRYFDWIHEKIHEIQRKGGSKGGREMLETPMGQAAWSPKIQKMQDKLEVLRLLIQRPSWGNLVPEQDYLKSAFSTSDGI
jgi:hypothetical protein